MAGLPLEEVEREHIRRTLEMTGQNRTETAKLLKIGERTLYRKIKEYGL
jgi:two-component system response regulator HydG